MAIVFIPPALRSLTGDLDRVVVEGETVRAVVEALDERHPGTKARLCDGTTLRPGLAIAVNGHITSQGLRHKLTADSEVHFLPAVGGG